MQPAVAAVQADNSRTATSWAYFSIRSGRDDLATGTTDKGGEGCRLNVV